MIVETMKKRKTDSTNLNEMSSRSHFMFTFELKRKAKSGEEKKFKISIIDLAGSENLDKARKA